RVLEQRMALFYEKERGFACDCVAVRTDDGMSWSAEAVRRNATHSFPRYEIRCMARTEEEALPEVVKLTGVTPFLRLAVRHHLTTWYTTMLPWRMPLILVGLFSFAVLEQIFKKIVAAPIKSWHDYL